jgi:hypothetical protein
MNSRMFLKQQYVGTGEVEKHKPWLNVVRIFPWLLFGENKQQRQKLNKMHATCAVFALSHVAARCFAVLRG